ncbi:hypothetical protein [Flavobacterium branchiicola]|uniref:Uncharacterized protein n=1 Tax=Flavobacterium branchiicola TaxID=1114875 RepID=A0ABV9PDI3_9FLAO|nr:hypothetical protein [Flavobacterium branchiicola]MBS7254808.1 hypothetical protein [Flavobacterium branchiicola]
MQKKNRLKKHRPQTKSKITNVIASTLFSKYGMTLEEYKEGVAIHAKCFDQIKKVKPIF